MGICAVHCASISDAWLQFDSEVQRTALVMTYSPPFDLTLQRFGSRNIDSMGNELSILPCSWNGGASEQTRAVEQESHGAVIDIGDLHVLAEDAFLDGDALLGH